MSGCNTKKYPKINKVKPKGTYSKLVKVGSNDVKQIQIGSNIVYSAYTAYLGTTSNNVPKLGSGKTVTVSDVWPTIFSYSKSLYGNTQVTDDYGTSSNSTTKTMTVPTVSTTDTTPRSLTIYSNATNGGSGDSIELTYDCKYYAAAYKDLIFMMSYVTKPLCNDEWYITPTVKIIADNEEKSIVNWYYYRTDYYSGSSRKLMNFHDSTRLYGPINDMTNTVNNNKLQVIDDNTNIQISYLFFEVEDGYDYGAFMPSYLHVRITDGGDSSNVIEFDTDKKFNPTYPSSEDTQYYSVNLLNNPMAESPMKKCLNCQHIYSFNLNQCPNCGSNQYQTIENINISLSKTSTHHIEVWACDENESLYYYIKFSTGNVANYGTIYGTYGYSSQGNTDVTVESSFGTNRIYFWKTLNASNAGTQYRSPDNPKIRYPKNLNTWYFYLGGMYVTNKQGQNSFYDTIKVTNSVNNDVIYYDKPASEWDSSRHIMCYGWRGGSTDPTPKMSFPANGTVFTLEAHNYEHIIHITGKWSPYASSGTYVEILFQDPTIDIDGCTKDSNGYPSIYISNIAANSNLDLYYTVRKHAYRWYLWGGNNQQVCYRSNSSKSVWLYLYPNGATGGTPQYGSYGAGNGSQSWDWFDGHINRNDGQEILITIQMG